MISKRIFLALAFTVGTASFMTTTQALAHAMLESSSPKNGETVSVAPKTINLEFEHAAKLTKLKLFSGNKEIPVTMTPSATAATTYAVPVPALAPAKYKVKWATLGNDGHPMTGSFSFTVSGK